MKGDYVVKINEELANIQGQLNKIQDKLKKKEETDGSLSITNIIKLLKPLKEEKMFSTEEHYLLDGAIMFLQKLEKLIQSRSVGRPDILTQDEVEVLLGGIGSSV